MIKYRVWDKKQNKYLRPSLVMVKGNDTLITPSDDGENVALIQKPDDLTPRFIIEQYTGLKDKFGTEIYEGDIIFRRNVNYDKEVFEDDYGVVRYIRKRGCFCIDYNGDIDTITLVYGKTEVLGNANQNSDLLVKNK